MHAFTVNGGKTTSAPAFQIRWEEDDLSILETNPLTPAAAETGDSRNTPSGKSSGSKSASPTDSGSSDGSGDGGDDNTGGGGLPTGAIVGIAVGVALLVAIVLIAGFLWYRKRYLKAGQTGGGQSTTDSEKPNAGAEKPFNPEGAPPVYPDVPQEMQGSEKVAPGELPLNTPRMSPSDEQASHGQTIQQLGGSPVPPAGLTGVSQHHMPGSNALMPSELYSSTSTMPIEIGSWGHPASGAYTVEIAGAPQMPELPPQQGMGELHATPVASELQASTVHPVEQR